MRIHSEEKSKVKDILLMTFLNTKPFRNCGSSDAVPAWIGG
jgi:hypothetical protein